MDSLHNNFTWELEHLNIGKRILPYKKINKVKVKNSASKPSYRARLVVKGYMQNARIDYDETSLLVVMLKSICILLSITTLSTMRSNNWMSSLCFLTCLLMKPFIWFN